MNEGQENQWREEFEDFYKDVDSAPNFKTNKYGDYSCIYAQENWSTYLAASKKAQEEIRKLKEQLKREQDCVDAMVENMPHYEDCDSEDPDDLENCNCGREVDLKLARETQQQRK